MKRTIHPHRACRVIDAELATAARQGDAIAWETLVRQHQTPVFRLAYLIVGDADAAEDIAQETFLRAFRSLHRFDVGRPLRPWLLQIATNLAYNQRRSAGRYFAALQRLFQATPPAAMHQEAHVAHDEATILWQAIRRLGRTDQEIIYMRYYLELTEAETAAALGIAPGTVKSRLHRALQRLRAVVQADFPHLQQEVTRDPALH
ncbi:MAG: RNA polymerase sigma factor [Caldilineales bacterium]|nr:RNA polymerase sigma factor [Caldilineales bacterium]